MRSMSVKPNASAGKRVKGELAQPFPDRLLRRARQLAQRYRYVVEPEARRFCARPVEFPEVIGVGASPDEALRQALELASTAIAVMLESERIPPLPCRRSRSRPS